MVSLVALYQTRLLLFSFSLLSHTVTAQACVNGDVRIEGTETSHLVQGIVQYCFNGVWSTVVACTSYAAWTSNEGEVACRQLGYDRLNSADQGCLNNSTAFVELNCPRSPVSNLQECRVIEVEGCDCGQRLVHAKLDCGKEGCTNGEIRLEGGPDNNEGRVEVCVNGRWGTVETRQPRQVAEAVCSDISLELSLFSSCLGTQFGYRQSKPVYHCDVSEGTLNCTKRDSEFHNHAMDLGVVCGPPLEDKFSCTTNGESFRLIQESDIEDGVEVCVDGRWGTVCTNSQEGIAGAVCSQPELPSTGATMGTGPQVTSEPARKVYHCYSNTTCVEACCDHPTSLTVKCPTQPQDVTTEEQPRGSSPDEGKLTTISTSGKQEPLNQSTIALVALPVLLLVLVVAVVICVVVVVVLRRRKQSPPGTATHKNESYSLKQLDDQVYGEATSTVSNYSSLGPGYDVEALKREEIDPYDVLDHNQKEASKSQPQANPTPVRDEVSKRGDDFYDAEEHTYSVVNVKKKRKAKKNCHGDQNIPSSAGADTYEVIDTNKQKMTNKPQDKSVRDEASKKEDDFYDAEEHTYAVVSKKKAKKTSEDSEGEREELPNNDSAMAGDSQT